MDKNEGLKKQNPNDIIALNISNDTGGNIYLQRKFLQMASILNILDLKGMKDSDHMPMLSVPFLDWLNAYDFSEYTLVEFGSGYSTNYFATRFKNVISFETNQEWFNEIGKIKLPNVDLRMMSIGDAVFGNYDIAIDDKTIVLVDSEGGIRDRIVTSLLEKHSPSIIFLDNSEWFPNSCQEIQDNGYMEIPFWGIRFEEYYDKCTSVFIKNNSTIPRTRYHHYTKGAFIFDDDSI
jgi:hypothetical protein